MARSFRLFIILLFLCAFATSFAQQCPHLPAISPPGEQNLFSEEQEIALGDTLARHLAQSLGVIEDDAVAARLNTIGQRLLAGMPPSNLRFRFYLLDLPVANAFAIAGGRVYVTRKLVAAVKSEDELAGVIAHELGHQLAHHSAIQFSQRIREMLGRRGLAANEDIESLYHQVLDAYRTNRPTSRGRGEKEQLSADQVAVYLVARAGYSPQALVDWWDKLTETKGRKGNWLSDLFGTTRPESKRLREYVRAAEALPPACRGAKRSEAVDDFKLWQKAVVEYRGFGKKESLGGVLLRRVLEPPLRGDIRYFKFSRDGKYLLAQDEASIFVLSRDPLANVFRIDAREARLAEFSPDSKYVVYSTPSLRVERWNIDEKRMEDVDEVLVYGGCLQSAVSPSGKYLACVRTSDRGITLDLLDVGTSTVLASQENFLTWWDISFALALGRLGLPTRELVTIAYSPDEKWLMAGGYGARALLDVAAGKVEPMTTALARYAGGSFAFIGNDRIVGVDVENARHSAIVAVPSGKVLLPDLPTGGRYVFPATDPDYLLVRPMPTAPLGLLDIKRKGIIMQSRTDALDVYAGKFVNERLNGEIGLYAEAGEKPLATVTLPRAPLGNISGVSISADLSMLAVSERTRGAVWNLTTGERMLHVRGFHGAWFDGRTMAMDFAPKDQFGARATVGEKPQEIAKREMNKEGDVMVKVDLSQRSFTEVAAFPKRVAVRQVGPVTLTWTAEKDDETWNNRTLAARDAISGTVLWSRKFGKLEPTVHGTSLDQNLVFSWDLDAVGSDTVLKKYPELEKTASAMKKKNGGYLLEVVDPRSGLQVTEFLVFTTGSPFRWAKFRTSRNLVAMLDGNQRILLFDHNGAEKGRLFGNDALLSPDGRRLCAETEPGRITVYDTATLRAIRDFTFGSRIVTTRFSQDAGRLLALTEDQTAFVLDLLSSVSTSGGVTPAKAP